MLFGGRTAQLSVLAEREAGQVREFKPLGRRCFGCDSPIGANGAPKGAGGRRPASAFGRPPAGNLSGRLGAA